MLLTPKYSQYSFCLNGLRERKGNNGTRRLLGFLQFCSLAHLLSEGIIPWQSLPRDTKKRKMCKASPRAKRKLRQDFQIKRELLQGFM